MLVSHYLMRAYRLYRRLGFGPETTIALVYRADRQRAAFRRFLSC